MPNVNIVNVDLSQVGDMFAKLTGRVAVQIAILQVKIDQMDKEAKDHARACDDPEALVTERAKEVAAMLSEDMVR